MELKSKAEGVRGYTPLVRQKKVFLVLSFVLFCLLFYFVFCFILCIDLPDPSSLRSRINGTDLSVVDAYAITERSVLVDRERLTAFVINDVGDSFHLTH